MALLREFKLSSVGFPFQMLSRDLKLLFACSLVGSFGDGLYSYLLPVYFIETLKASAEQVGILYAAMSFAAASTLLVAGILADKYDRKKIMIAGWLAWLPAPLIFSVASNWFQALPGMLLWGFWLGGPTTTAYILGTADKSRLTLTFTTLSAAWSFGYIFSPALGGYLAGISDMRFVFYSATVLYGLACFFLLFVRSQFALGSTQTSKTQSSFFELLKTRKLLKLSIFFALVMFVLMMFRPFVPQFLAEVYQFGKFEIGVLGSVSFFSSAVLGILLGKVGDKWKKSYALFASMVLCSGSLLLLILSNSFLVLIIAFFVTGGSYLAWSLMSAVVGPLAPEHVRARWISIPQTMSMFCSIIAPYVGGVLYGSSPYYPLIVAIVATFVIALVALSKLVEE